MRTVGIAVSFGAVGVGFGGGRVGFRGAGVGLGGAGAIGCWRLGVGSSCFAFSALDLPFAFFEFDLSSFRLHFTFLKWHR